ncbi:hypothetical protein Anas_06543 [Armadillidium nasatum]|uniref:Phospholipid/glycerol acyltransferase domain-containing protein n=1 Tax=Armadillidium nasatum TaxID=96803 RepID=A0A5N5SPR8_9CRUS|nr:hypothetical protein Anas_06543 [Armadillidium nasatum]
MRNHQPPYASFNSLSEIHRWCLTLPEQLEDRRLKIESRINIILTVKSGILFVFLIYGSMLSGIYTFYCPILPFIFIHRSFYRKGTDFLFPMLESFFVGILELIFGVKFYISGDIIKASESSIILLNHRTRLDWLFFFGALAHRTIPPAHNCKIVLKSTIKEIPGIGWGMQINHYVFLRRNWNIDKDVRNNIRNVGCISKIFTTSIIHL